MKAENPVPAQAEHRLHPMSWLFVLLAQIKHFIIPLFALFVFGRRDYEGWWPLIGLAALAAGSIWQYLTYRYGVGEDALVVRSGLLERSVRVIPFARIHNVAVEQSLLHRLLGVAEVRLESAGGRKPEATMRVLTLTDALALETLVRRRGRVAAEPEVPADTAVDTGAAATTSDASRILLGMGPMDLLRLGLVSNRGMILVGAGLAAISQMGNNIWPAVAKLIGGTWTTWNGERHWESWQLLAGGLALLVAIMAVLRVLSLLLVVLQYYGFELRQDGRRLTVERGLLARWRTSTSRRRIQAWTLREDLLHRLLGQRSLEIDTAASEAQGQTRALHELAPIAPMASCDQLIDQLLPHASWHGLDWQPLPIRSWWRRALPTAFWTLVITTALYLRFDGWGLLALAWLPWATVRAYAEARRARWTLGDELVGVREGWWSRYWRFAEIDKLQALQLTRTPLDRCCGTATLWLDTAGAGARAPGLRIRYLPHDTAEALYRTLSSQLALQPLRW